MVRMIWHEFAGPRQQRVRSMAIVLAQAPQQVLLAQSKVGDHTISNTPCLVLSACSYIRVDLHASFAAFLLSIPIVWSQDGRTNLNPPLTHCRREYQVGHKHFEPRSHNG